MRKKHKAKKASPAFLKDPVFHARVWIFYRWEPEALVRFLKKHYPEMTGTDSGMLDQYLARDSRCASTVYLEDMGTSIMSLRSPGDTKLEELGTFVHEAVHVAFFQMERKGLYLNRETDEVYAYFTEYITKQCVEVAATL